MLRKAAKGAGTVAKNLEISYLLDFYGEVLTQKQRDVLEQYYNDDLSLSEIAENFGITRQGVRDAIKHGEATLLEMEEKVGFAARYRHVQEGVGKLEHLVREAKFANSGSYSGMGAAEVDRLLEQLLAVIEEMDEPAAEA